MIIALAGLAGCGKSTAATYLAERHGFARVRFAGPLKAMVRAFLVETGVPAAEIERMIEGDRKEGPAEEFAGATPRHVMQALGTEWGRSLIHPELWTRAWGAAAAAALAAGAPGVVAEDCRFDNEAAAVRALGGFVVRIERPGGPAPLSAHVSEQGVSSVEASVRNEGPPEALFAQLDELVAGLAPSALARAG